MDENKQKLLRQFLESLLFEGWTESNLKNSAAELKFPEGYLNVLFSGGLAEFTLYFANLVEEEYKKRAVEVVSADAKLKQKATGLMMLKLRLYQEKLITHEGFKKFISYFFNPANMLSGLMGVYNFADDSWHLLSDKSTDFSFYTKRLSFGAIYAKAAIYALNDESENLENTEKFIERRIDELMKFGKLKQKFNNLTEKLGLKK